MGDTGSTAQTVITGPDGQKYKVTGPAGTTLDQHAAAVQSAQRSARTWRPVASLADLPVGTQFRSDKRPGHTLIVDEVNPSGLIWRDQKVGDYQFDDAHFYPDYFKHFTVSRSASVRPAAPVPPVAAGPVPSYMQSMRPSPAANPIRDWLAHAAFQVLAGNDDLVKQLTPTVTPADTANLPMPQRLLGNTLLGAGNVALGAIRMPFEAISRA